MERILGPFSDVYIAAFTVKSRDGCFGYAKACAQRPSCMWDGTPALVKVQEGPFEEEVSALAIAIDRALEVALS